MKYDFTAIEKKWQDKWLEEKPFAAVTGADKEKFFGLIEFPYPSALSPRTASPSPAAAAGSGVWTS